MPRHSFASSEALWEHLEKLARQRGVSTSYLIREALYAQYDADGKYREPADAIDVGLLTHIALLVGATVLASSCVFLLITRT